MKNIIAIIIVLGILSCNQQNVDIKAEGEKIMQMSKEWSQVALSGDAEKTLSFWAEEAILMSSGQPQLNGKK